MAEERVRAAVEKAVTVHPLLGCRWVPDHGAVCLRPGAPLVPLRAVERTSADQWRSVIAEEHAVAFDFEAGPLFRFILLAGDGASDLVVYGQHTVCDGLSLASLLRQVLAWSVGVTSDEVHPVEEGRPAIALVSRPQ